MEASLAIYDALVKINVPHAEAREVVGALERDMSNTLATKSDIAGLRVEFLNRFELVETRITVRLGGLIAAGVGLLATLLTVYRT